MALLGAFVDSRTNVSLASQGSLTYAHGLPANPDIVWTESIASIASSTNWWAYFGLHDATNITAWNPGSATGPSFRIVSAVLHSIIR